MISQDDIARIQEELGRLALETVRIDVDGFIEASDLIGSPQAMAAGVTCGQSRVRGSGPRWHGCSNRSATTRSSG